MGANNPANGELSGHTSVNGELTYKALGATLGLADSFLNYDQAGRGAEFAAAQYRSNAAYEKFLAGEARALGAADARMRDLQTAGEIGRLRADFGASGVDANVGTPLALAADSRMLGDYDAALIRHRAEMKAAGHDFRRYSDKQSAAFQSGLAAAQRRAGVLDMIGSGLKLGGAIAGF